jgi:tRNA (guanosine-2'-O-)-methyltransferase
MGDPPAPRAVVARVVVVRGRCGTDPRRIVQAPRCERRAHGIVPPVTDAIDRVIQQYGPDAICEALAPMLTPERIARIDEVLAARLGSVMTIVEDTYDPHNAAATIRTTEAIGLQELHVIEPGDRFSVAGGVTRGSHKWIEITRWKDPAAVVHALHARGFRVYATLPGAPYSIDDVDVTTPIAVAFGNEHAGLSPAAIDASSSGW